MLFPGCDLGEYLGTGHYGVVYPTEKKGIVFKITSDESEAGFIQTAIDLRENQGVNPPGIVKYDAVIATNSKRNKFGKVFVIWREEALEIGLNNYRLNRDEKDLVSLLDYELVNHGHAVRSLTMKKAREIGRAAEYWKWLRTQLGIETSRLNESLRKYRGTILTIVNDSPLAHPVGVALEDYLDSGIVLADVHSSNVGTVRRGSSTPLAITDPGRAVFLKESLSRTAIEVV